MYNIVPPNILDIESTPSSVAVRENQNINMTCRADGFPTPKIIWRREDGESITVERKKKGKHFCKCHCAGDTYNTHPIYHFQRCEINFPLFSCGVRIPAAAMVYDGEVLPLSKVSRNEMGAYLCIATNGVPPSVSKRIILDVECKYLFSHFTIY